MSGAASKATILVIDDDPGMLEVFCEYLQPSFQTLAACSVADALQLCRCRTVDLLLVDIRLPGEDGLSLANKFSKHMKDPSIILISGFVDADQVKLRSIRGDVRHVLEKPISRDKLLQVCEEVIEKNRELKQAVADQAENWTPAKVEVVSRRYQTRSEFAQNAQSAYKHALKHGYLDRVCAHMNHLRTRWDRRSVEEVSRKFSSRSEFRKAYRGAYEFAWKRGILDEVCAHMNPKE